MITIPQRWRDRLFVGFFILGSLSAIWLTYEYNKQYVGFIITAIVGLMTMFRNQRISKRSSTINILTQEITDKSLSELLKQFFKLVSENEDLVSLAKKEDSNNPSHQENKITMFEALNYYEFLAGGIREGAFDYKLFHRMFRSNIISIWSTCSTFVIEYRRLKVVSGCDEKSANRVFIELENLASDFAKHKP